MVVGPESHRADWYWRKLQEERAAELAAERTYWESKRRGLWFWALSQT